MSRDMLVKKKQWYRGKGYITLWQDEYEYPIGMTLTSNEPEKTNNPMKTLTLSSPVPKNDAIQLDIYSDRICSFCGGKGSQTVEGSLELKVAVPETELLSVPYNTEYVKPLFGANYEKIVASSYRPVVVGGAYKEKTDTADICIPCIRQLAKLTKDMKVE